MSDINNILGELDAVLGANYTDSETVSFFQAGVVQWLQDNPNLAMAKNPALRNVVVDGVLGPKTRNAAAFVNRYLVTTQPNDFGDAITDETLAALPKNVTFKAKASAAQSAEMRRQTAREAAAKARAARTPVEVKEAAVKVQAAAQESPPEVKSAVAQAVAQAQAARTPDEAKAAAMQVQAAADQVVASPGGDSVLDVLKSQYGPLPFWGWGLLVGVAVGMLYWFDIRRRF